MTTATTVLPFQPDAMTPAQLAAVSYLARYSGQTHALYTYQLRRWFGWCQENSLDPLMGVQRHTSSSTYATFATAGFRTLRSAR